MADHSKKFEITIAALGMIVTGMLGYGQIRVSQEQNRQEESQKATEEKRAADDVEVKVMTMVAPHFLDISKPGENFEASLRVIESAATYLTERHSRPGLALMATQIARGNKAVPQEVQTRLQEATVVPLPSTTRKWFAVLASLPASDLTPAQTFANERLQQLKNTGLNVEIQLFKTKISNNYAVVVGGPLERNDAIELASQARSKGLARDAFVQQDRDWTFVGKAPFQ